MARLAPPLMQLLQAHGQVRGWWVLQRLHLLAR